MRTIKVATFNTSLSREQPGQLNAALASGMDPQCCNIAETIQRVRPDLIVLNEFDYDASGEAARDFQRCYLAQSQRGGQPIDYPHLFIAPVNSGVRSGFDLSGDGRIDTPADAWGYGRFAGQYGMLVLSRWPILHSQVRTFRGFRWRDMPGARLPRDPVTGRLWYSEAVLSQLPLSSKSHWDLPVQFGNQVIHLLASHPTPPVFDGAERRNACRNHDEIRFWYDYIDPVRSTYIYDDNGGRGGLSQACRFVIAGDLNASAVEGDADADAIKALLGCRHVNAHPMPISEGALQHGDGRQHSAAHTAVWRMRADYVLPSAYGWRALDCGVFWPPREHPLYRLVFPTQHCSDHRMVWIVLASVETLR